MSDETRPDGEQAPRLHPGAQEPGRPAQVAGRYPPTANADGVAGDARFERIHPLDYWRVLYKRRWLAVTSFLLVAIGGIVYAYRLVPVYEAHVRLLIEGERLNIFRADGGVVEERSTVPTQLAILRSRSLARRTLAALDLLPPPVESVPAAATGSAASTNGTPDDPQEPVAPRGESPANRWQSILDAVSRTLPFSRDTAAPDRASGDVPGESLFEAQAIDAFLGGLEVSPVRDTALIDVRYRSPDPALAARYADAIVRQYVEQNLEFRFMVSKEVADWLAERLAEQREKVEASERALLGFRERHDVISADDGESLVVRRLNDIGATVTQARAARIEKEALYNQFRAVQNAGGSLETFPTVLSNPHIQRLRVELERLQAEYAKLSETLLDRHPRMIQIGHQIDRLQARLKTELDKIVASVHAEFVAARETEESLAQAFEAQKRDALALNRRAIELGVLQRDAESNRQIYEILMQRAKETSIAQEIKTSNIRIIDAAEVPRRPYWPNRAQKTRQALLWAFVFAIAVVFSVEYFDNRIKVPDDIRTVLNLPFLGLVPVVRRPRHDQDAPMVNNGSPATFIEAFRMLRTNVLFSGADNEGARLLLVTSTGPAEGKTLVASNLAITIAQAGQRVLLIDGDLRRPRAHALFGETQEPGLSNLIGGMAKASEAVRKSSLPDLYLLPAGVIPPNPAELLGSRRFKDFLAQLNTHFDWVIVDSPPVMVVTDASVIAHRAAGVVFVVSAEMTNRRHAREALQRLEAVGAGFVGAVLNRVDLERNPYYYGLYYRSDYSAYYSQPSHS